MLQYFNIGAGYVTAPGARRESDVLLTEGSESAWFGWGDPLADRGSTTAGWPTTCSRSR